VHFWGLILAASLFTLGIIAFVYNFIRHGMPKGELDAGAEIEPAPPAPRGREAEPAAPPRRGMMADGSTLGRPPRRTTATVGHEARCCAARARSGCRCCSRGRPAAASRASSRPWRHELGRPLVTVACNDETSAADLLGAGWCAAARPCGRTVPSRARCAGRGALPRRGRRGARGRHRRAAPARRSPPRALPRPARRGSSRRPASSWWRASTRATGAGRRSSSPPRASASSPSR
jgi:hypothetical protein